MADDAYARAPFVHLVSVPQKGVAFRTASRFLLLEGEDAALAARLWPHLDGARPVADVAARAGAPEGEAAELLEALADAGLAARAPVARAPAALLAELAPGAAERLAAARVVVVGDAVLARAVADAVAAWGARVEVADAADAADLVVAVARAGAARALVDANARALGSGTPALFVEWRGIVATVGPFLPGRGKGACWACADLRAWANAESPEAHEAERGADVAHDDPVPAPLAALVAGVVAADAVRALAEGGGTLVDAQLEVNAWDATLTRAPVLPVPGCPACGFGVE